MTTSTSTQNVSGEYAVVPTFSGTATVILKAAGGGGGSETNPSSASSAGGGGGGAGGSAKYELQLQAGVPYIFVIGQGGEVLPNADQSQSGGDTVCYIGRKELYRTHGGGGGCRSSYGQGGNGGAGGAPDGGGGGGGGESNNGFGPQGGPGAGGSGASEGGLGGAGGSCGGYIGGAGGGGGAGGAVIAGGNGGGGARGPVPNPGNGGQVPGPFTAPLSPGDGLAGRRGTLNGLGSGGGGGGASQIATDDVSGRGGFGYGQDSTLGNLAGTPGMDGLVSISFSEPLTFVPLPSLSS